MQHGLLCGGESSTSAGLQATTSPGWSAETGARAAKREVRVCARGRSSSHATMRSILMAAAIATCCKCVFGRPRYRVRSEEHTSELQSQSNLVCRLLLEKKKIRFMGTFEEVTPDVNGDGTYD